MNTDIAKKDQLVIEVEVPGVYVYDIKIYIQTPGLKIHVETVSLHNQYAVCDKLKAIRERLQNKYDVICSEYYENLKTRRDELEKK